MDIREGVVTVRVAPDAIRLTERSQSTLSHPDERQLARGIKSTDVPTHLNNMVDLLVSESNQTEEGGTGVCLEYLLKNGMQFVALGMKTVRSSCPPRRAWNTRQAERT